MERKDLKIWAVIFFAIHFEINSFLIGKAN
jgi:hypothetical protein